MALALEGVDVSAVGLSKERIGQAASQSLWVKGFCVLEGVFGDQDIANVLEDVVKLDEDGYLEQPPTMIVDGLLGAQGSSTICDLGLPNWEDPDRLGGDNLLNLDWELTELGTEVAPLLGLEVKSRTGGVVHRSGMPEDEGPELSGEVCAKWINAFAHHRLMLVLCLGPSKGSLELQPFDDESNGHEIPMRPGTLVMLRADALQHRFTSIGKAYCLTCFFQKESRHCRHRPEVEVVTPCCEALEAWAYERMREYKDSSPEEQLQMRLPRAWENIANHTTFVGQHIAVRTTAIRQPNSWDPADWASAFTVAPDFVCEVPLYRWDNSFIYDPSAGKDGAEFAWKTNCQHGAFMEGAEMFDNALFRLSKMEAKGMDPGHRLIMETGYEALFRDGYRTKQLMNSRGGVYFAAPNSEEWGTIEKEAGGGICGGGSSVGAGRFSFTHGIKGPCLALDNEAASGLVAVNMASTNLSRCGQWEPIPFAVCNSYHLLLNPRIFCFGTSQKVLSPGGRTFSLDASASGYVRSDSAVSIVLKALTDLVDDEVVYKDQENFLGALAASATNQSGRRAHMTAPDAASIQEVLADCVYQADISPLDVDACDVFADGFIMHDAVEASATVRALRPDGMQDLGTTPPLGLLAVKSSLGNQENVCGLTSIVKVVLTTQLGLMQPNLHFRILNPFTGLDLCDSPANIATELLEYSLESSYTGITNRSLSGTNCHVFVWGQLTEASSGMAPEAKDKKETGKILFWPEGGGELQEEQMPRRGYYVIGTWTRWQPEPLEQESPGVWATTLTLGENRWEHFQIVLDGERHRALHPAYPGAAKGALVLGPASVLQGSSWLIDGRPVSSSTSPAEEVEPESAAAGDDVGQPGDQYRIRLHVRGKWRTVDWERLPDEPRGEVESGTYHVVGAWNQYDPQAMTPVKDVPGAYTYEVQLVRGGRWNFQLLRNRDWCQVLGPASAHVADGSESEALDPDENFGHSWELRGGAGDVFLIEFQKGARSCVSWRRLRHETVPQALVNIDMFRQYYLAGSWDGFSAPVPMNIHSDGYAYAYLELGPRATESFLVYLSADPRKCYYPDVYDANPYEAHAIQGPGVHSPHGARWLLGPDERDQATPGNRYEIRAHVDMTGQITKVTWQGPLRNVEGLDEAQGRGFFIVGA